MIKNLCYKRTDTAKESTITYNTKYTYTMYLFLILFFVGFLTDNYLIGAIALLLLSMQWIYSMLVWVPVSREIKRASFEGYVKISGNKNSVRSPITYIIKR